jgi:hypothetical protein
VNDFAASILSGLSSVPSGVMIDNVSVDPGSLLFDSNVISLSESSLETTA